MCASNPHVELVTTWGFTHEEIMHRWKIWTKFDPLARLFGNKKTENKTPVNGPDVLQGIKALFGVDVTKLGVVDGKPD